MSKYLNLSYARAVERQRPSERGFSLYDPIEIIIINILFNSLNERNFIFFSEFDWGFPFSNFDFRPSTVHPN